MSDSRRRVLERVSTGEITPEEALALLAQPVERAGASAAGKPRRVVIKADLGALTVVADPTVQDAVAVGAHELRHADGAVKIKGAHGGGILSDGRLLPRRGRRHALRVRMRPDLPLEVRLGAGTVHVEGLEARAQIEIDLGTATLERLRGPFGVKVGSGSVSVQALVDEGESAIACDLGAVSVRLDPLSSVEVSATTDAGRILLPEVHDRPVMTFGTRAQTVVGNGAGWLDIKTGAGSISVVVDR